MRWDDVVRAIKAALDGDAGLAAIMGGRKLEPLESTTSRTVPSIRYTVVSDVEREVTESIMVQLDYWANGRAQAVAIEQRIRAVLSHPTRRDFGGVNMATLFYGGRDSSDPEPGVVHRQIDYRFDAVRSIYT